MVLSLILKYICQKLRKNISGQWSGLPSARPWILCQDYMYLLKCVFSKQICILIIRNLEWQIFGFPESFKLFYNEDKSCKYSWFPWCFTCLNFTLNGYIFFLETTQFRSIIMTQSSPNSTYFHGHQIQEVWLKTEGEN